jgi:hypothetical protein
MEDSEPEPMIWILESEEEKAEAQRFYDAVNYCNWTTIADLEKLLREPGPWLIRWRFLDQLLFLSCVDERILFNDADPNAEVFVEDPKKAVKMESALALRLIPRLAQDYAGGNRDGLFVEPVRPKDAMYRKTW